MKRLCLIVLLFVPACSPAPVAPPTPDNSAEVHELGQRLMRLESQVAKQRKALEGVAAFMSLVESGETPSQPAFEATSAGIRDALGD